MSEKRRDNKNRILRNGESQRNDGRYVYVYVDGNGNQKFLYSWKLEPNDTLPSGKRDCVCLRDKIKLLKKDQADGIIANAGKMTVLQLVEKYISQKTGVRHNTEANYRFVINIIKKEEFGCRRIDSIKLSDAKAWLIKLQADGRGYSTIHTVRGVVRPAFQLATDDDLIRKNPFEFQLATVVVNDSVTREAITRDQERKLLKFIKNDKHFSRYYDGIYVLFKTGVRISEFCGLIAEDIDFENQKLRINRQLQRTRNMQYIIESPKTTNGERYVPMDKKLMKCFKRILKNRKSVKVEPVIDGIHGFLFLDKNGMPMVALHWEKYFEHICHKYNKTYKEEMPKVTPHVCRHTFCSNKAKSGMNPKTLQYIMGHGDIGVTLNTYTHVDFEDAKKEMKRLKKA